jgi:hypothetical protein
MNIDNPPVVADVSTRDDPTESMARLFDQLASLFEARAIVATRRCHFERALAYRDAAVETRRCGAFLRK